MKQFARNILVCATILYIALPTQGFRLKRQSELGAPVVGDMAPAAAADPAVPDAVNAAAPGVEAPAAQPIPGADVPSEAPPSEPVVGGGEPAEATAAPAEDTAAPAEVTAAPAEVPSEIPSEAPSEQPGVDVAINGEPVSESPSDVQPSPILDGVDSVQSLVINDPLEITDAIQNAIPSDAGNCGASPLIFLISLNAPVAQ